MLFGSSFIVAALVGAAVLASGLPLIFIDKQTIRIAVFCSVGCVSVAIVTAVHQVLVVFPLNRLSQIFDEAIRHFDRITSTEPLGGSGGLGGMRGSASQQEDEEEVKIEEVSTRQMLSRAMTKLATTSDMTDVYRLQLLSRDLCKLYYIVMLDRGFALAKDIEHIQKNEHQIAMMSEHEQFLLRQLQQHDRRLQRQMDDDDKDNSNVASPGFEMVKADQAALQRQDVDNYSNDSMNMDPTERSIAISNEEQYKRSLTRDKRSHSPGTEEFPSSSSVVAAETFLRVPFYVARGNRFLNDNATNCFYIETSTDVHAVVYEATLQMQVPGGMMQGADVIAMTHKDTTPPDFIFGPRKHDRPLQPHWINQEDGARTDLNLLERNFVYNVDLDAFSILPPKPGDTDRMDRARKVVTTFRPLKNYPMTLSLARCNIAQHHDGSGCEYPGGVWAPVLTVEINSTLCVAERAYIKRREAHRFYQLPATEYIDLFGYSLEDNAEKAIKVGMLLRERIEVQ